MPKTGVEDQLGIDGVDNNAEEKPGAEQMGKGSPFMSVVRVRDDIKPAFAAAAGCVDREQDWPEEKTAENPNHRKRLQVPQEEVPVDTCILDSKLLRLQHQIFDPPERTLRRRLWHQMIWDRSTDCPWSVNAKTFISQQDKHPDKNGKNNQVENQRRDEGRGRGAFVSHCDA